jgi:hypothetical protein
VAISEGAHKLSYDPARFDFRSLMLEMYREKASESLPSLEQMHTLPGIADDVEYFRQLSFSFFRQPEFQAMFKAFGAWLIDAHFDGKGMIQKTPTVRIQLPGSSLTSYHTDGWYGHGEGVRSFWLPLTKVYNGNTLYMAESPEITAKLEREILDSKATLEQINVLARDICRPLEGDFGDMWTFSHNMIHGADYNSTDISRFSFDFRVVPETASTGTKPTSNYYTRAELDEGVTVAQSEVMAPDARSHGLSYSNKCNGKSAKSQLMLVAAYANANNLGIVNNESEIINLPYMPVMRSYLSGANERVDCVITFGLDIFEGQKDLAAEIFKCADKGGRAIHFAAEGLCYTPGSDPQPLLDRI